MHETFLDFSLPIPKDKVMYFNFIYVTHTHIFPWTKAFQYSMDLFSVNQSQSSPGFQARGRKTEKGGKGGNYTYKLTKDEEEIETAFTTKNVTMSKHQQKKAKKKVSTIQLGSGYSKIYVLENNVLLLLFC